MIHNICLDLYFNEFPSASRQTHLPVLIPVPTRVGTRVRASKPALQCTPKNPTSTGSYSLTNSSRNHTDGENLKHCLNLLYYMYVPVVHVYSDCQYVGTRVHAISTRVSSMLCHTGT